MEVCFFCKVHRPDWEVKFETNRKIVVVSMCKECYMVYSNHETEILGLYCSKKFWLRIATWSLLRWLVWRGMYIIPFRRVKAQQFLEKKLEPRTPAWFALRLSDALNVQ